jgi:hypothetical protein
MKTIDAIDTTGFQSLREAMQETARILKNVSECYTELLRKN